MSEFESGQNIFTFVSNKINMKKKSNYLNLKILRIRKKGMQRKLQNTEFSIISNNCVGGTIYKDLELPYLTPFVGLYILPKDFIKLCTHLDHYLSKVLVQESSTEFNFPVGLLGDVQINFMHYSTFENAKEAWERRLKRMKRDKLMFILVDRDGCTLDDLVKFDGMNHKYKLILTSRQLDLLKNIYIIKYYKNKSEVGDVLEFKNSFTGRRVMHDFDFIKWINDSF